MKPSFVKVFHDSSKCDKCLRTKLFYKEVHPTLEKHKKASDDVKNCGIITFLKACFQYDKKVNPKGPPSKFINSIGPLIQFILDNIIYKENNTSEFDASFRSNIYALNYKYSKYQQEKKISSEQPIVSKTSLKKAKSKVSRNKPGKKVSDEIKKSLDKIPTKGTLKRKRWYLTKLINEEDYEDDIFEEQPFHQITNLDEDSDISDYSNVATPNWCFSLSPRRASPTPSYEGDCYNVEELRESRKVAEKYQHTRKKLRRNYEKNVLKRETVSVKDTDSGSAKDLEDERNQPSCSYTTLECTFKDTDIDEYSSDEVDNYYTDSEEEEIKSKRKTR